MKKNSKRQIKQNLEFKNDQMKGDKLEKWKVYDNSFHDWYSEYLKISEYFPQPYKPFGEDISVKLDLSNYATKADLKRAAGFDISNLG